ncbi:hypothetical protein [Desulfogranum marinum]|uniref:hypothetical protein n=1 Tax=Desulfogranum marinum TaxID=453220 RepID=UPI001966A899|nr:hypothetical protein [Desulfogranum marinum]MBM9513701.1 hypothetical protein [Desulfogranum marinum]
MRKQIVGVKQFAVVLLALSVVFLATVAMAEEVGFKDVEGAAVTIDVITDINQETRVITLKNEAGEKRSFTAGPEVRNFAQLKRGDFVIAEYYQGFAVALEPSGSGLKERISELTAQRAKEGEKPGVQVTTSIYAAAEVTGIDLEHRVVSLEGAKGVLVLKVQDDIDLAQVEVGQEVEALYTESFAVSVIPAPKLSGKVTMKVKAVALGVGVEWGEGMFSMYDGTKHGFKVTGLTLVDVGISGVEANGEVYNLVEAKDLEGTYIVGEAGAALVGGGSALVMKNSKGVVLKLQSVQKGVRLTFAGQGLKISLK